jgi:hypothetical protein
MNHRRELHEKQNLWETWVRTPIFADDGVYNIASRYSVILDFVKRGLVPFVKRKGYIFFDSPEKVTLSLLRYMFALYTGQKVIFKNPHKNIFPDHVYEFEHRFDSLEVEEFWAAWNTIEDFQPDRYAHVLQYTLPSFLWPSINIKDSPITLKIEKILDEVEDMEAQEWKKDSKGREDPYLHESSRYEDKHW